MFDDPKRRLQELEEALKAAEMEESPEMEAEAEEDWLQEFKDLLNESATEPLPIRNKANNYGQEPAVKKASQTVYTDRKMEASDAVYVEPPKRKGAGGLVILALLELIAMGLIVLWWIRWMG